MEEAKELLAKAEEEDGYRIWCKRDPLNNLARRSHSYVPWHDQSEARRYEEILEDSVRCVIMHPTADGGMPHTRGKNLICIPAHWSSPQSTLKHELIHIHQKQNPGFWRTKLLDNGWQPDVEIPWEVARRCRLNPDTMSLRFSAYAGRYVPLPLYVREDKPDLREIQVRWFDLEEERVLMDAPYEFIKKFGHMNTSSMEHPFEYFAYKYESNTRTSF